MCRDYVLHENNCRAWLSDKPEWFKVAYRTDPVVYHVAQLVIHEHLDFDDFWEKLSEILYEIKVKQEKQLLDIASRQAYPLRLSAD